MGSVKQLLFFAMAFIFIGVMFSQSVSAQTTVVANTDEWESVYLLSIYAHSIDAGFVFFKDPSDAQLKTKLIPSSSKIITFESGDNAILKSYCTYLEASGFDNVETIAFNSFKDLQKILLQKEKPTKLLIFNTDYAVEPLLFTPYILRSLKTSEPTTPYFYTDKEDLKKLSKKYELHFVGRIPVREIPNSQFDSKSFFHKLIGMPDKTSPRIIDFVLDYYKRNNLLNGWAELIQPAEVDFDSFNSLNPFLVYYGKNYDGYLLDAINGNGLTKLEVIGGDLANEAKRLESKSGKDLKLMVKYGRRITNYAPYENKILSINSVSFPYPLESMIVENVTYYNNKRILAITFKNTGNTDLILFSTASFGKEAIADEDNHVVLAGTEKTIPFNLVDDPENNNLFLLSSYAFTKPLVNKIVGGVGKTDYQINVTQIKQTNSPKIIVLDAQLDKSNGDVFVRVKNDEDEDLFAFVEIHLSDGTVYTSKKSKITSKTTTPLTVSFPYIENEDLLGKTVTVKTYFGVEDTIHERTDSLRIINKTYFRATYWFYLILVAILVFLTILFFIFMRRKN